MLAECNKLFYDGVVKACFQVLRRSHHIWRQGKYIVKFPCDCTEDTCNSSLNSG